jgi:hypothetical protein
MPHRTRCARRTTIRRPRLPEAVLWGKQLGCGKNHKCSRKVADAEDSDTRKELRKRAWCDPLTVVQSFIGEGATRFSTTRLAKAIPEARPGISVSAKTIRNGSERPPVRGWRQASSHTARRGPMIAPIVSPARWNPNALPRSAGGTELASIASRRGLRTPRPNQASARPTSTGGQPAASANSACDEPVRKYPPTVMGFRWPSRSESQPDPSFTKLDVESATPSISPNAAGETPRTARKPGRTAVAISWPASDKRLVIPMPITLRFNQESRCGFDDVIGMDWHVPALRS